MQQQQARRWLLIGIIVMAVAWFAVYLLSIKSVTVSYHHIKQVQIYKTSALDAGKSPKPAATITTSGKSVRLRAGAYTAYYTGEAGYESKYQAITVSKNHQVIDLTSGYSQSKLNQMLDTEYASIAAVLQAKYPRLNGLYSISRGQLYQQGDWYGTTLVYRGSDIFNSDTLRVVVHKEGGVWQVKTDPPSIVLTTVAFPGVPKDVLRSTNNQP